MFGIWGLNICLFGVDIGSLLWLSWFLFGGIIIGKLLVIIFVIVVLVIGVLYLMLKKIKLGCVICVIVFDLEVVEMCGIDVNKFYCVVVFIVVVLVVLVGVFLVMWG